MHEIHSKWHKPKTKHVSQKKRKQLQEMRDNKKKKEQEKKENASADKLADSNNAYDAKLRSSTDINETEEFLFIHRSWIIDMLKSVSCSVCFEQKVSAAITEKNGSCVKSVFYCAGCKSILGENYTSPRLDSESKYRRGFVVNRRLVDSINNIGLGYAALKKFCTNLGASTMTPRTFQQHLSSISKEANKLQEAVLKDARETIRQAYIEKDPSLSNKKNIDIACSYDGTWHKRGHTSHYGVGIAIDMLTGLVIDFQVLSKYCHMCATTAAELGADSPEYYAWYEEHQKSQECNINFEGSSGSMEVRAAEIIWCRSIQKHNLRYTTILSDGDARTWTRLNEISPYGQSVTITKEECINHVHKRMGKGLRDIAKREHLGGKKEGALTGSKIDLLTKYYRRAIVNNLGDVQAMRKAVKATLFHCSSTDVKPNHRLCPAGSSSWCFYKKAKSLKETPRNHNCMQVRLSESVVKKLIPLYDRLSEVQLLERCSRGGTQNANEGLHAQIWRKCPKEVFVSRKRIHLAVINAVMEYNCGVLKSQTIKAVSRNETLSDASKEVYKKMDQTRFKRKTNQEEYRHTKRARKCVRQRNKSGAKSKDYGAGEH